MVGGGVGSDEEARATRTRRFSTRSLLSTMTSLSTLLSPLLTPLLALWLAGQYLPVPAGDMAWDIVRIV